MIIIPSTNLCSSILMRMLKFQSHFLTKLALMLKNFRRFSVKSWQLMKNSKLCTITKNLTSCSNKNLNFQLKKTFTKQSNISSNSVKKMIIYSLYLSSTIQSCCKQLPPIDLWLISRSKLTNYGADSSRNGFLKGGPNLKTKSKSAKKRSATLRKSKRSMRCHQIQELRQLIEN